MFPVEMKANDMKTCAVRFCVAALASVGAFRQLLYWPQTGLTGVDIIQFVCQQEHPSIEKLGVEVEGCVPFWSPFGSVRRKVRLRRIHSGNYPNRAGMLDEVPAS